MSHLRLVESFVTQLVTTFHTFYQHEGQLPSSGDLELDEVIFSSLPPRLDGSGTHLASYTMSTGGSFSGDKAAGA